MTSRHYWLGKLNSRIIRRLSVVADVLVTNTEHHAAQPRRISRRADIHLVPVGSNIEVAVAAAQSPRERAETEFVVFGMSFGRWQTLRLFEGAMRRWHAAGQLTRLHLIGPGGDLFAAEANELMRGWDWADGVVVRHGILPSVEVSQLLSSARFTLTNVSDETWGKSTTLMACAAHRCAVVISAARPETPPLLHAVQADEVGRIAPAEIDARTASLTEWYHANADWPVIAARLAALWERK